MFLSISNNHLLQDSATENICLCGALLMLSMQMYWHDQASHRDIHRNNFGSWEVEATKKNKKGEVDKVWDKHVYKYRCVTRIRMNT